jgi:hypothetical protein
MQTTASQKFKIPSVIARSSPDVMPPFGRLPTKGLCPYTSISRGTLLHWDRLGLIHLVRICRPGLKRGVVLIPLKEVCDFIRSQAAGPRTA